MPMTKRLRVVIESLLMALLWMIFLIGSATAKDSKLSIETIKINDQGVVTIVSDITMSPEQGEMLENGIPLIFNYHVILREKNRFGFWQRRFERKIAIELKYHALSKQYVIRDERFDTLKSFPTLSLALTHIGYLKRLPMINRETLRAMEGSSHCYQGVASLKLDIEALPAPLRIPAYLSKKWRLNSGRTQFTWGWNDEEC